MTGHHWAIETADGSIRHAITRETDLAAGGHDIGVRHVEVDRAPVGPYERPDFAAGTWVVDLPTLDAFLARLIDEERDRRANVELNPSASRQNEYTIKLIEAMSDIGPWPWLQDLAARRGTTVEDERLAVLVARDVSDATLRAIAGVAVASKAAVRAATTAVAKMAAFEAIEWPAAEEA